MRIGERRIRHQPKHLPEGLTATVRAERFSLSVQQALGFEVVTKPVGRHQEKRPRSYWPSFPRGLDLR